MYVSIEGQGHFFTIYFPGFLCFVLYFDKVSGERLQDHWSSGLLFPILVLRVGLWFNCASSWLLLAFLHFILDVE